VTATVHHDSGQLDRGFQPTGVARLVDVHSFVFWVYAVVVCWCGIHLFSDIAGSPQVQVSPANSWMALVQWAIYALVFLAVVYHHQLFVRRSPWVTASAFVWGGLVATWFAARANEALQDIFTHWFGPGVNERWGTALSAATNEETLKALGLVTLALLPLALVRTTLDGWFYGMMIGLGFQVVEDYIFTVNQAADLTGVFAFLIQRGFISGLFAHAVYTGIAGLGVGFFVARTDRTLFVRVSVAVSLFLAAWTMHLLWDLPQLSEWLGSGSGALVGTVLIKGLPALAIMLVVLRWGRQHERVVWAAFVAEHIDPTAISTDEVEHLLSRRDRRAAARAVARTRGRASGQLQERLQWAQLRYVQHVREEGFASDRAVTSRRAIDALRAALAEFDSVPVSSPGDGV
jgi:RsiW-degrading membrane proteinase PrsW (M82 family)